MNKHAFIISHICARAHHLKQSYQISHINFFHHPSQTIHVLRGTVCQQQVSGYGMFGLNPNVFFSVKKHYCAVQLCS